MLTSIAWSIADRLVGLCVGGPVRASLLGAALLWLGYRYLGWWTFALVAVGAAWELAVWPGRAPGRWR